MTLLGYADEAGLLERLARTTLRRKSDVGLIGIVVKSHGLVGEKIGPYRANLLSPRMDRMMGLVGVDPAVAVRVDKGVAWDQSGTNCISCCHECECRNWLECSEGLPVPPDFLLSERGVFGTVRRDSTRRAWGGCIEERGPVLRLAGSTERRSAGAIPVEGGGRQWAPAFTSNQLDLMKNPVEHLPAIAEIALVPITAPPAKVRDSGQVIDDKSPVGARSTAGLDRSTTPPP